MTEHRPIINILDCLEALGGQTGVYLTTSAEPLGVLPALLGSQVR
jgi:hypothetical protein